MQGRSGHGELCGLEFLIDLGKKNRENSWLDWCFGKELGERGSGVCLREG